MNESTVRRLKSEYLKKLKEVVSKVKSTVAEEPTSNETTINTLKIKQKARPFLLGADLDVAVQEYIQSLRMVGGAVNTLVLMAAAEGSRTLLPTLNDSNLNLKSYRQILDSPNILYTRYNRKSYPLSTFATVITPLYIIP